MTEAALMSSRMSLAFIFGLLFVNLSHRQESIELKSAYDSANQHDTMIVSAGLSEVS